MRGAACALPRGVACLQPVYRPRDAEHTVLHQVIGEHLDPFLREAAEAGERVGLPQFVDREFLTGGAAPLAPARSGQPPGPAPPEPSPAP